MPLTTQTAEELATGLNSIWKEKKGFEQDILKRGLNDINSYKNEPFTEEVIKKNGYET